MELGILKGNSVGSNYDEKNYLEKKLMIPSVDKSEKDQTSDKKSSEIINANEINLIGQQSSTLKELFAKKAAWKLQTDQFKKDLETDENIKNHADRMNSLLKEAKENQSEYNRLNNLKVDLKETYSIEDDSSEQQDLELLEKQLKNKESLTEEEKDRLNNMGPLTEYQKAAFEYATMAEVFLGRAETAVKESKKEAGTISAIKQELLKNSPMIDAKKEAEDLLETVDEEIQKAIIEELKKRVNDKLDIDPQDEIMTDPQKLIEKKKVTEEDIKGLAVDEKV